MLVTITLNSYFITFRVLIVVFQVDYMFIVVIQVVVVNIILSFVVVVVVVTLLFVRFYDQVSSRRLLSV